MNETSQNENEDSRSIQSEEKKTEIQEKKSKNSAENPADPEISTDKENGSASDPEPGHSKPGTDQNSSLAEDRKKSKSRITGWIIAAVCVLALTLSVSLYLSAPKVAGANDIEQRSITLTNVGFDTPVTLQSTCTEDDFNRYVKITQDTFREYGVIFDAVNTYDDALSLKAINDKAHEGPVEVDPLIIEVLNDSINVHELSGSFDPSQGKLTALWRDAMSSDEGVLPDPEEVKAAINPDSMDAVHVDGNTIELTNEAAALDFGAIAKGFTAQQCADRLRGAGMDYGFLNAGGNVVLIGEKPDGAQWRVGIQNPDENSSLVIYHDTKPTCLVTSGDYQRYMIVDGVRYSHIIDPSTGYPATYMRSVTVINPDSTYCDGMSTALFCLPVEEGLKLCQSSDLDALWICDKGQCDLEPDLTTDAFDIYMTDGLKDHIELKN